MVVLNYVTTCCIWFPEGLVGLALLVMLYQILNVVCVYNQAVKQGS